MSAKRVLLIVFGSLIGLVGLALTVGGIIGLVGLYGWVFEPADGD